MESGKSYIRNWHEPKFWARTQRKFGVFVYPTMDIGGNIELRIEMNGKEIKVVLKDEEKALFLMNMDKNVYKKEGVKRTDYGLSDN